MKIGTVGECAECKQAISEKTLNIGMVSFAGLFSDYAVSNLAHEETAWNENKRFRRGHPIKISTLRKDGHKLILVNFD